jgi:uncharacterized protein YcsI (UPF0317 family)
VNPTDFADLDPRSIRKMCRAGTFHAPTAGVARGFAQANLVILPAELADDFDRFCAINPKPCPLLERTEAGDPEPKRLAPGADLRTDLPRYRVFRLGECVDRPVSIEPYWRDDLVAFLIGCSFTFEWAMIDAGLPVRHIEEGRNVPMYRTSLSCEPAGRFSGPMVVSMRPMMPEQARHAERITAACDRVHGAPIHAGDASKLGIVDLDRPDYGDPVTIRPGEIPVFWACGVTPIEAVMNARPNLAITHEPGHMFITDATDVSLRS